MRTQETDVEVFGGEVESLTTAGIEGIGVRVIADHRQGLAWAGSLDPDVIAETLREARDNAGFGEPDEWYGLASPADVDGASPPDLDLWRDDLLAVPTDEKVRIALELERATKAADPRIRNVESATLRRRAERGGAGQLARRRGAHPAHDVLGVIGRARRRRLGHADRATGSRPAARSPISISTRSRAMPPCGRAGCSAPSPCRVAAFPVILDPLVTRSVLGVLSSAFNGESMLKGRSLFTGRRRRTGRGAARAAARRSHRRACDGRVAVRRRRRPDAPQRADRRRCAAGLPAQRLHRPAFGHRARRRSATRGFGSTPGVGVRALRLEPGPKSPEEIMRAAGEAFYVQSVSGLHSGTNPISGDFSVGADGLMVRDGAFAEPVREVTIASTLQRMLLDIAEIGSDLTFLPGAVAGMTVLVGEMTLSGA